MNNKNNNTDVNYGIEKFEGTFDKEEFGVTIIPNKTINEIRNAEALGLYVFLLARPSGWKLNVQHLKNHFQLGRDKIRELLNWLIENKYISCNISREKGRFSIPHYRVHLSRYDRSINTVDLLIDHPKTLDDTGFSPEPENPAPVSPETVDQYTYKTKNIISKDINNKISFVDSEKSTKKNSKDYKLDELFMKFYNEYPQKQKPVVAHKAFLRHKPTHEFVDMLIKDVRLRLENNWKGRETKHLPFPSTYLNTMEWLGVITPPDNTPRPTRTKYKTMDEIMGGNIMDEML